MTNIQQKLSALILGRTRCLSDLKEMEEKLENARAKTVETVKAEGSTEEILECLFLEKLAVSNRGRVTEELAHHTDELENLVQKLGEL